MFTKVIFDGTTEEFLCTNYQNNLELYCFAFGFCLASVIYWAVSMYWIQREQEKSMDELEEEY